MKLWKPIDIVIVVLTVTICSCLFAALAKPMITGVDLSEGGSELVATMMASVISIVSMYVGAKLQSIRDNRSDSPQ